MPYINSDGTVTEKRSWIRLSLISDFIWGVVDAFGLFFSSLYNPSRPITAGRYVRNRNESSRTGDSVPTPRPARRGGSMTAAFTTSK